MDDVATPKRVLSGIQPTGRPHWGNYFGAIRQYIELQERNEGFYFIADLHALTTVREAPLLRQHVIDTALDLLALGLDPKKATLFVQSQVPEVSELCWILLSGTPMGLLQRCVAYKEKVDKGISADAGLFTYPVLQAADILAYDSQLVPVGADQVQHIEVCRDIAGRFNHQFGDTFVMPLANVLDESAKVPGTDGEKMSKSYDNVLPLFGDVKKIRKQIMRITTDSRPMEEPKEPSGDHLFELFSLFADQTSREEMAAMYRRGGFGYGEVKKSIAEASESYFADARERRNDLEKNLDYVQEVLRAGAERARNVAGEVLLRAQRACGLK
jgi:tryptophanyl-tRNA synthetase